MKLNFFFFIKYLLLITCISHGERDTILSFAFSFEYRAHSFIIWFVYNFEKCIILFPVISDGVPPKKKIKKKNKIIIIINKRAPANDV